jgi:putative two-component system response regulator
MDTDQHRLIEDIDPSSVLILLVSDDAVIHRNVSDALRSHGFRLQHASSGESCLESIREHMPHLVMLDRDIRGMTAFETCTRITLAIENRFIPIILLSTLTDTGDVAVGMDVGCTEYLTKPVNPLDMYARVTAALRTQRMVQELESAGSILKTLATSVEARDGTTGNHCDRLAHNAALFGREMRCSRDEIRALRNGGYLHDIGKVAVPDAVLNKPGKLTPEEWEVMKRHVIIGEDICRPLSTMQEVLPIIRHHHERFNGSGYPDNLAGEKIPKMARVFQLTDVFDALTSARPYKKAFSADEALHIMQEEADKGLSDPAMFKVFHKLASQGKMLLAHATE